MSCKKLTRHLAALLAAAALVVAVPSDFGTISASAASLSELQQQSEQLKKEAESLQKDIAQQEADKNDQQAYKASLDKKIDNVKAQIDLLDRQIAALNTEVSTLNEQLSAKEAEIQQKEEAISAQFQQLRLRLRAISKTGNLSALQMLLDTDNYTDYLIKSKMMERVSSNDQALMEELENSIQKINEQKQELDLQKASVSEKLANVQKLKSESNTQKSELDTLYAKATAALQKIQSTLSNYQSSLKATEAEQEALEKQIVAIINANSSNGKYGGSMFWPVPTVRAISSYYGWRWGKLHKGIDIANGPIPIYGENIVAASSGTVIYANSTDSWGGGYGYHIIIDHGTDKNGNTISTLYAHCSKVNVRVGQKVVGGTTVIAQAGASGNVTGPHLHFEVRVNGTAVDPIKNGYVSL